MFYGKPMAPLEPQVHDRDWANLTKIELRDIARREWAYAEKYYNAYEMEHAKHYYYKSKFDEVSLKLAELKKEIRDAEGKERWLGECRCSSLNNRK